MALTQVQGSMLSGSSNTTTTIQSNNTTAMTINSSQQVGIGTTSPSYRLHVSGNGTGTNSRIGITNTGISSTTEIGNDANGGFLVTSGAFSTLFYTNDTERMRITPTGYLKQSNTGSYFDVGGPYSIFENTADFEALAAVNKNNSLSRRILILGCTRTASSAYNMLEAWSGDGSANPYSDREFALRGDGNGYADGTWNNNGADYAEYFESATGQVIPTGSTVVLENNKVRLATNSDSPDSVIGVVRPKEPSKASMVIGNTAWNKWANKYLTDDFDRYIMEDHELIEWTDEDGKEHSYDSQSVPTGLVVPSNAVIKTHDANGVKLQHYKINPEWNPDSEYVNRENRDEWLIIGLIGQVKILKGQSTGDRWIKMSDVSELVEEWFIR